MAKNWIKSHARNFTKNTQSTQIHRKKSTYFFINFKHVKMSQNNQKCIKKHIVIFLGIFVRKLKRAGVQVTRTEACIAKTQEKSKETKGPRLQSPNPRSLVDPDLQNASEALD